MTDAELPNPSSSTTSSSIGSGDSAIHALLTVMYNKDKAKLAKCHECKEKEEEKKKENEKQKQAMSISLSTSPIDLDIAQPLNNANQRRRLMHLIQDEKQPALMLLDHGYEWLWSRDMLTVFYNAIRAELSDLYSVIIPSMRKADFCVENQILHQLLRWWDTFSLFVKVYFDALKMVVFPWLLKAEPNDPDGSYLFSQLEILLATRQLGVTPRMNRVTCAIQKLIHMFSIEMLAGFIMNVDEMAGALLYYMNLEANTLNALVEKFYCPEDARQIEQDMVNYISQNAGGAMWLAILCRWMLSSRQLANLSNRFDTAITSTAAAAVVASRTRSSSYENMDSMNIPRRRTRSKSPWGRLTQRKRSSQGISQGISRARRESSASTSFATSTTTSESSCWVDDISEDLILWLAKNEVSFDECYDWMQEFLDAHYSITLSFSSLRKSSHVKLEWFPAVIINLPVLCFTDFGYPWSYAMDVVSLVDNAIRGELMDMYSIIVSIKARNICIANSEMLYLHQWLVVFETFVRRYLQNVQKEIILPFVDSLQANRQGGFVAEMVDLKQAFELGSSLVRELRDIEAEMRTLVEQCQSPKKGDGKSTNKFRAVVTTHLSRSNSSEILSSSQRSALKTLLTRLESWGLQMVNFMIYEESTMPHIMESCSNAKACQAIVDRICEAFLDRGMPSNSFVLLYQWMEDLHRQNAWPNRHSNFSVARTAQISACRSRYNENHKAIVRKFQCKRQEHEQNQSNLLSEPCFLDDSSIPGAQFGHQACNPDTASRLKLGIHPAQQERFRSASDGMWLPASSSSSSSSASTVSSPPCSSSSTDED